MINYSRYYKRINLTTAKKLFNCNVPIIIVPCKCSPDPEHNSYVNFTTTITKKEMLAYGSFTTLESFLNEYTYYNCNNELGKSPAFYIDYKYQNIDKIKIVNNGGITK